MRVILIFLLLIITLHAYPQRQALSTQSSRAEKHYTRGAGHLHIREFEKAEKELIKATESDIHFTEAWMLLGDLYIDTRRFEDAAIAYTKSLHTGRKTYPEAFFFAGSVELKIGWYDSAYVHLERFLSFTQTSEIRKSMARLRLASAAFSRIAIKNPVPFRPKNLGPNVNSSFSEYFPCLTVDDKTLLFTRRVSDKDHPGREQEDFYISNWSDTTWSEAKALDYPINTYMNEGAPTLSSDGQRLFFTACAGYSGYGESRIGFGSCDLFMSVKHGNTWQEPVNLGNPINTSMWETQPGFSSDGRTLFFIRGYTDRMSVYHQDIYFSVLDTNWRWSRPEKMPDNINTPGIEESVFIHPDSKTLYFSSDGHPGMGGLDIFITRKQSDGSWSEPENIGYPINTFADENSLMVSGDGKLGYFASDREGGYGKLDLYSFEMPERIRPNKITYLKGIVYDEKTHEPLAGTFELTDLATAEVNISSQADATSGEFLVALPTGKSYALNVSSPGYLFYSDHFNLEGDFDRLNPYIKDVPLQPIIVGETVILRNVFFDTDSYLLLSESKIELDRLSGLLKKNQGITIEISGHTDNQGDDAYNLELSLQRSKSVMEYLINQGIKPIRMTYKGYGETLPVQTNDTENGRARNRRTEFKIIEVR